VKTRDTKNEILDAAQEYVQRWGANAMSYQHISEAVGIRKASIHHHFPSKEKLLEALIDRYSDYFLGLVDVIVASPMESKTKLRKYIALFEATLSEGKQDKACMCGMLGAELATLGSSAAEGIRQFYRENEKRLTEILDEGRQAKKFHFEGSSRVTAKLIFSFLEGGMLVARAEGGVQQFQGMTRQMLKLIQE
jgi:TetR/AcrR family transcriptional regulator, transcriptional repressor for nem operon